MAYDGNKRLLLNALLKSLAYAIRHDQSGAERYRHRVHLAAEEIVADNEAVQSALQLLSVSGLWLEARAPTNPPDAADPTDRS
jgi:hypothetical protein